MAEYPEERPDIQPEDPIDVVLLLVGALQALLDSDDAMTALGNIKPPGEEFTLAELVTDAYAAWVDWREVHGYG